MSSVVIEIAGVDVTDDVIFADATFTSSTGRYPGEFELRIKDPTIKYAFETGNHVTLDVDSHRVFDGYALQISQQFAFDVVDTSKAEVLIWHLRGPDVNIMFQKRIVYNKASPAQGIPNWPVGTTDLETLDALVASYLDLTGDGFSTDFHNVGVIAPDEEGAPYTPGDQWGLGMDNISQLPGAVWGIKPDRTIYYEDDNTENAPFRLSDRPDNVTTFGYSDLEWLNDGTRLANDAPAWGVGIGWPQAVYARAEDATSIATHGRWQAPGLFRSDIFRQTTINKISNSVVYGSPQNLHGGKDDSVVITCRVKKPGLIPGQKVYIESQVHGVSGVYPIRRMTMTFPTPTDVFFDLQASYEIDRPYAYHNYLLPPTLPIPGPPNITIIKDPCTDIIHYEILGQAPIWSSVHSYATLGRADGGPSGANIQNKKRYWQKIGFFDLLTGQFGDGFDSTVPYVYTRLPFAPSGKWMLSLSFTVPTQIVSPGYHLPPFPQFQFGQWYGLQDTDMYPRSSLTIMARVAIGTSGAFTDVETKLFSCAYGVNRVAGQASPVSSGTSWNAELLSNGDVRVWSVNDSRPSSPNVSSSNNIPSDPNPAFANDPTPWQQGGAWEYSQFLTGIGTVFGQIAPGYLYLFYDTWGAGQGGGYGGQPGDSGYDHFFEPSHPGDEGYQREPETGYSINYTIDRLQYQQLDGSFNFTFDTPVPCGTTYLLPPAGTIYCEDLTPSTEDPTVYPTRFAFTAGTSVVDVDGIRQRLLYDYSETNQANPTLAFREQVKFRIAPSDSATVHCCYKVAAR